MLSISSYPSIKLYNNYNKIGSTSVVKAFTGTDVSDLITNGDKALNENKYEEALKAYTQANNQDPQNNSIYKKLGKTYFHLKNYSESEKHFKTYLENTPNDAECWLDIGETQRMAGYYQRAAESFEQASKLDSSNDLARRKLLETKNNMLSIFSPERAKKEKDAYATKNLNDALQMTVRYMTPEYMKSLENVKVMFGETASMGGTSNIAQYENHKNTITVSNSYIYASPQVIAAYLTHETVHAKDADAYTSVYEEQDAYEIATEFWINNANGIKDPEMDYAADLYKKSPATLRKRVEEIYTLRDPSIAKTSPNHPPTKLFNRSSSKLSAATQSIKQYDVIA
ncbi:tetratricopeptide repeat protein [bacterium]|nr:tetratricopeptide repeat protein [bacterium]